MLFFKQKTAYDMRISDWRSDVCSSDLAARLAILAGVDMSMQSGLYIRHIPDLVKSGAVPMETVDVAVRRILYVKTAIGLFENPYRSLNEEVEKTRIFTPDRKSVV